MKKYAFLIDNTVVKIETIDENQYEDEIKSHDCIIDVDDMAITPEIGWVLAGNKLVSNYIPAGTQLDDIQQASQQKFGQKILIPYINKLGSRNLKLTREGVTVDVAVMASQMSLLKLLLETGALKTAKGLSYQMRASHLNHSDILNEIIAEIANFLSTNGWN